MTTEIGRHQRQIGRDVEHARVQVAHQAVPAVAQRPAHAGRLDPAGDLGPGALVLDIARDRAERDAGAQEGVAHLGQRAGAAIGQPLPGVEAGVVHDLGRLQVDEQHRGAAALGDRQQHRGGHVGGEEADDQITAGNPKLLGGPGAVLRVGDEPDVDDVAVQRGIRSLTRAALRCRVGSRSGNCGQ